jgi:predicted Zn-dependent protease
MKNISTLGLISLLFIFFVSCARNPVTGKRQVVLMSEEQEIAMGKEADPQIIAQYGLYPDSVLQNFINERGKKMASISHRPNLEYAFRVLDSDVLNAFAVPGGYVYFTRGIMAYFNNEAEFAGVLGHEIGHITARHSVVQQRNAILGQIGLIAGMVISPEFAQFGEAASQGLGLLFLKFGRDAERQSDKLGVEYSSQIGYDAQQMADFFNTLERKQNQSSQAGLPDFLSTHPNPGDRYTDVSKYATEWKEKLKLVDPAINRNAYLKKIDGIIYGEDPKQGFVENEIFYHPVLKFQFPIPTGWAYQNSPDKFQMAPKDGKAMMMLTLAAGKTLQEAATGVLQQYKLQHVETKETTVNGLRAIAMLADQTTQQQTIRTLSYLIQYGDYIYHMIGVSNMTTFNFHSGIFAASMQNFKTLTDPEKLNRQPHRIQIKTVAQNSTLEQSLKSFNVQQTKMEEHAILNGMKLTDPVIKGTLIKVVGEKRAF